MEGVKKHECLRYEDYYESRTVSKGRSDKTCEHCGKSIPIGMKHDMHHFYPEFESYPVHLECSDDFLNSLITNENDIS